MTRPYDGLDGAVDLDTLLTFAPSGATHVVAFTPPSLFNNGAGGWELRTLDGYDHFARTGDRGDFRSYPDPHPRRCGVDEAHLARWVAGVLGYPVELQFLRVQVNQASLTRWGSVPACYVSAGITIHAVPGGWS